MTVERVSGAIGAVVMAAVPYTIACPPFEWSLAAWAVPGVLLVGCRRLTAGKAFACGGLFALLIGYGITGWALPASLEYFGFNRLVATGFVVCVWLLYGGLQYGFMLAAYAALGRHIGRGLRPALAALLWAVAELMRASLFTGMPWELLGHTQFRNLVVVQIADIGGVYAISFVMAFVSVTVAEQLADRPKQVPVRSLAPAALLLAVTATYGVWCRSLYRDALDARSTTVAIVQGNIPNSFRWKRALFERAIATYAGLTSTALEHRPDLIVWPENAVNFYVDREPLLRTQLGTVAALADAGLLVGGPRLASDSDARNSAYLIDAHGEIRASYDKRRLVPFAEYNPLPGFAEAPSGPVYTPGVTAEPLALVSTRLGTTICYEILFPHLIRDTVRRGAEVLVNLSNDSWLDPGDGAASRQHFSMSVFRAIESRRFLIRAASSGASGFVSPYGEVSGLIPAATAGSAVGRVAPRRELTVYMWWGDAWILVAACLLVGAVWADAGRSRMKARLACRAVPA
jgi:apolipoprotein N-acyltransferase